MRVVVLLNAAAGSVAGLRDSDPTAPVWEALRDSGVEANVRQVPPGELAEAARRAAGSGVDAVVAGGGDGTLSAVAGALAGGDTPMAVLPLGTLNHFAKDLGIPLELGAAARFIAAGSPRPIDVGEVNGRVFINNSSIGLYAEMVRERDELRYRLGHGKWMAMLRAGMSVFRRYPTLRVRIGPGGGAAGGPGSMAGGAVRESRPISTPFVFVGNNEYQVDLFSLGGRACMDKGHLSLYVAHRSGRFGLVRLCVLALLGRLRQARDFESMCLPELWIDTPRRRLHVAVDGEVVEMPPPLHYRVRPGALRVICPAAGTGMPTSEPTW